MNDLNRRLQLDIVKFTIIAVKIGICVFIGFMLYIFFAKDNSIEETRLKEFSGVVLDKYRIRYEHDSRVIKIKFKNKEEKIIYLNHFDSDVFDKTKIGDTVSTKSGDSTILIHRKDTIFSIYKMEKPAP